MTNTMRFYFYERHDSCDDFLTETYDYVDLPEGEYFTYKDGRYRMDGEVTWKFDERPSIIAVHIKYYNTARGGRHDCYGRKWWEDGPTFRIERKDKKELHKRVKKWFPDCQIRYSYTYR